MSSVGEQGPQVLIFLQQEAAGVGAHSHTCALSTGSHVPYVLTRAHVTHPRYTHTCSITSAHTNHTCSYHIPHYTLKHTHAPSHMFTRSHVLTSHTPLYTHLHTNVPSHVLTHIIRAHTCSHHIPPLYTHMLYYMCSHTSYVLTSHTPVTHMLTHMRPVHGLTNVITCSHVHTPPSHMLMHMRLLL